MIFASQRSYSSLFGVFRHDARSQSCTFSRRVYFKALTGLFSLWTDYSVLGYRVGITLMNLFNNMPTVCPTKELPKHRKFPLFRLWGFTVASRKAAFRTALTLLICSLKGYRVSNASFWQFTLTLSLPRVINLQFPLQPLQKYYITQYGELGFL